MACKGSAVRSRLAPPNEQGLAGSALVLCSWSPSSSRPRTPGFHLGNRGSNPLGDAINRRARLARAFLFIVSKGLAEVLRFDKIAGRPLSHVHVLRGTGSSLHNAILDVGA
jgi:hypothetical protein